MAGQSYRFPELGLSEQTQLLAELPTSTCFSNYQLRLASTIAYADTISDG